MPVTIISRHSKPFRKWGRRFRDIINNWLLSKEKLDQESIDIITHYAQTWRWLHLYDENRLVLPSTMSETSIKLDYPTAIHAIASLKQDLIQKEEASPLFARERDNQLQAILGDIHQTFGGNLLYPSCEERAAHLLYFVIKNHPFIDGNKRIGSFLFIRYLRENNFDATLINDGTLTMLALHIASSQPNEKDSMIKLIVNLITKY
ncbi:MAG: Fic family protein [Alphaproteobacteria bacterium]|nr:Fic family protein [Alphaproteobacteria bacterium]